MPSARAGGFTLVEVLVATAILVTVAAGSAQLFAIAIRHDVAARQQLVMSMAATAKLEEIAAVVSADTMPAARVGAVDRAMEGYSDTVTASGASFERRWVVAPLSEYSATAVVIVVRVVPRAVHAALEIEAATIREARAR